MGRQQWATRIEFFLTAIGFSIGVADLWRFPYLVMKNGGGAFLIPVIVFNIVGAIPIVYLEMYMGQYSQSGAIPCWNVCPLFKGVGYGTVIATFFFSIYYGILICWMFYYFIHSFFPVLPWTTCDNEWNVPETCVSTTAELYRGSKNDSTLVVNTTTVATSVTSLSTVTNSVLSNSTHGLTKLTSAQQFWRYRVLDSSDGLETLGAVNWPILGCLAFIVILCYLIIVKGVKVAGKVVYVTVFGPFILLAVFLVRGAILPGADIGVKFYLTPDLEKLKDPKIWAEACMQVFVSVGPGFGGMITFASYNKFTNNCLKEAILLCLIDLFTGIFGGFVIFSVLGHVSWRTGIDIKNFDHSGYGLGFIGYPEAANYLPPPQLWCALFFFMSIFLGLDSQFLKECIQGGNKSYDFANIINNLLGSTKIVRKQRQSSYTIYVTLIDRTLEKSLTSIGTKFPNYEIVVTALRDEFPKLLQKRTVQLPLVVVLVAFVLAIPMVTQGGFYLLTLVDWYAATFSVTIFSLLELLVLTYIYGMKRIDENMREMTGNGVPIIFKIAWYFVTPLLIIVTLGFTVYTYKPPAVGNYEYPGWAVSLGWCIAMASIAPIPLYMVYILYKTPGTIIERFRINLRPNNKWGPRRDTAISLDIEPEQCVENNGVLNVSSIAINGLKSGQDADKL